MVTSIGSQSTPKLEVATERELYDVAIATAKHLLNDPETPVNIKVRLTSAVLSNYGGRVRSSKDQAEYESTLDEDEEYDD